MWSSGYVSEIDYTHGYYLELSPGLLRLACVSAAVAPPPARDFSYLELGFGQGLSINIHAAACDGSFHGTDFNPSHAVQARTLAAASGTAAVLRDDSFAELAQRPDLPEFDYIALHGIWSWISDENRRVIVDLIRRRLRVGGLVYISYNCLPGWAPAMPLRHLMTLHAELAGSDAAGIRGRIEGALEFAKKTVDSGALYFRANPAVAERLKLIAAQDRNYLAHEYFNRDWDVMAFSDVARWLEDAKLTFVASANLLDHVEAVNLSAEAQTLLGSIHHPILRQSVRDYFVNQQFRRDIFVKGPHALRPLEQNEAFDAESFVLVTPPDEVPLKVNGALGEATLQESIYRPLIQALANNGHAAKTAAELRQRDSLRGILAPQLYQALLVLTGAGHVSPARHADQRAVERCRALNRHIAERARAGGEILYLASPVTGAGAAVTRFQQLFLLAAQQHRRKTPDEWAEFAWGLLAAQSQRLVIEGRTLESPEDNLAELRRQAADFAAKRLPVLKALAVA